MALTRLFVAVLAFGSIALGAPPKVVGTIPKNGGSEVDPGLKEFRVTFDQAMSTGGMSVVGSGPKFPRFVGKPRWENDQTLVWSWQLEPEREYWLSINSDRFTNFRGQTGEPAAPYPIAFRTGKGSGASPTIQNRDAIMPNTRFVVTANSPNHRFANCSRTRISPISRIA